MTPALRSRGQNKSILAPELRDIFILDSSFCLYFDQLSVDIAELRTQVLQLSAATGPGISQLLLLA